jgi:hypothetical protein
MEYRHATGIILLNLLPDTTVRYSLFENPVKARSAHGKGTNPHVRQDEVEAPGAPHPAREIIEFLKSNCLDRGENIPYNSANKEGVLIKKSNMFRQGVRINEKQEVIL